MPTPNKILELDKEHLREIDGVTLDLDSYTRHIDSSGALSPEPAAPPTKESRPAAPAPVFAVDPVHVGWYEPAVPTAAAYPMMAGALIPTKTTLQMPGHGLLWFGFLSVLLSNLAFQLFPYFMDDFLPIRFWVVDHFMAVWFGQPDFCHRYSGRFWVGVDLNARFPLQLDGSLFCAQSGYTIRGGAF